MLRFPPNSTGYILDYWEICLWGKTEILMRYYCSTVVWELTVLGLPPGFEAVGSEGCHHILNGVAVGVSELIVHPPRIAFKTVFCLLTMDRDRDTDVSGACETYRVFWGLEKRKTHSCGQQESRCSGRAPVFLTLSYTWLTNINTCIHRKTHTD